MIVFHDFFYKAHPRYLDRAVGLMRQVNECGLVMHNNLYVFVQKLKNILKEDGGGRYEKGIIGLTVVQHQIQIDVKGGLDYAARICYFPLEKGFAFTAESNIENRKFFQIWEFDPCGQLRHVNREVDVCMDFEEEDDLPY